MSWELAACTFKMIVQAEQNDHDQPIPISRIQGQTALTIPSAGSVAYRAIPVHSLPVADSRVPSEDQRKPGAAQFHSPIMFTWG